MDEKVLKKSEVKSNGQSEAERVHGHFTFHTAGKKGSDWEYNNLEFCNNLDFHSSDP